MVADSYVPVRELEQLALALVAAPSPNPPGDERQAIGALLQFLNREQGIETKLFERVPGRPTLVSSVGRGTPCLALAAHIDTHPVGEGWTHNPLGSAAEDGRLFGRGTTDNKGAVAAMTLAFRQLARTFGGRSGRLILIANADEETGGDAGVAALLADWDESPDAVVVAEASGVENPWESLWTAARGTSRFTIKVRGTRTHSSLAGLQGIVSATESLPSVLNELEKNLEVLRLLHPVFGRGSRLTVVRLEGGDGWGTVPGEATALCELRVLPPATRSDIEEQVTHAFKNALVKMAAQGNLEFAPGGIRWMSPSETRPGCRLVDVADEAWATILSRRPKHACFPGATDARLFQSAGIPSVVIGPGALVRAHHADEFVTIEELLTAYSLYLEIATRFLGLESQRT